MSYNVIANINAQSSTALAAGVVAYAFNQRANFYSAMVYLSQNNLSLMVRSPYQLYHRIYSGHPLSY